MQMGGNSGDLGIRHEKNIGHVISKKWMKDEHHSV